MNRSRKDSFVAIGVIVVAIMMLIPLPTPLLDAFMALNLMGSLAIILLVLYSKKPSEFTVFPTLLLIATVFGLGLNISSTRLILTQGSQFDGRLIRAFSRFVIGGTGNEALVIGVIIFLILIAVQIVVITRGATRSAEVAARFTLDSMVQKNLSIDSQVSSGAITAEEGAKKRAALKQDVDFYSAMDGASKFVSGNVKVGILITMVNIIGGLVVGICFKKEPFYMAVENYTALTIGDGLVTQFPALMISTATAIIVTRSVATDSFAAEFAKQISSQPKVFLITSFFALFLSILPGFRRAWYILLPLAVLAYIAGRTMHKNTAEQKSQPVADENQITTKKVETPVVQSVEPVTMVVGLILASMIEDDKSFLDRITEMRSQIASELGFAVPRVRITSSRMLGKNEYVINIKEIEASRFTVLSNKLIAVDFDNIHTHLDGERIVDPVSGHSAFWIEPEKKTDAVAKGFLVSDVRSMIITHLTETIKLNSPILLGRQELASMLDEVAKTSPAVVDEVKRLLSLGDIQKIFQNLLREQVSIRDMVSILESIADNAVSTKDTAVLTEKCRQALARQITAQHLSKDRKLHAITIAPELEERISESTVLDIDFEKKFSVLVSKLLEKLQYEDFIPVLLCMEKSRFRVKRAVETDLPQLCVMSVMEVAKGVQCEFHGQVEF